GDPIYENVDKVWDEINFVKPAETEVERSNRTYLYEKDKIRQRIILMRRKLMAMYDYRYPIERRVIEERLTFLETEYYRFDYMINPYHVLPGLILDVDITSIKRKKKTLDGMGNVLNEFLHSVSKGFQDAAFASFSRRRSTVREDISQSFGAETGEKQHPKASAGSSYLDMLNADDTALDAPKSKPKAKSASKK
ncbi:MAG: cytochrome C oxidase subunit II, partial [Treponema sp.]|nr:cytochrome C oxidase subunit II [Treponema sp.]